ncbi:UNVERIFIED_CONTAM: hypothetical protein GTU68_055169, partial [Idotea baltica]|nr:hypothetical protein [Idotea baltica]
MRVRVIGAGVVGLCVATELTARGAEVELIDTAPAPGPHACSWWAGGMLAPWCEAESAEEPVERLGQEAFEWWAQHTSVATQGTLVVALGRDKGELDRFARRTTAHETLKAAQIAEKEPDLGTRFDRALYFKDEAHLAPRDALAGLTTSLAAKGVMIRENESGSVETTIDCRGLAARDTLTDLRGVKGEMLVLHCPDVTLTRPVRLLHPRIPLYIVPRGDGIYMLGATMIES